MKLVHPDLSRQIVFQNYKPCEWIIESPHLFGKYVQELRRQATGEEGGFVISEGEKEYDVSKCVEIIADPLNVNINEKKILTKLYSELEKIAYGEELFVLTQETLCNLQRYFSELEQVSPYILHIGESVQMLNLFKALEVQMEDYAENYLERIDQYIKIVTELLKKKLLVMINIRSYLDDEQLKQLMSNAAYNEINSLLIESVQRKLIDGLSRYIIDFDGCEI